LSSILVHPGWVELLGRPSSARKGVITGIYYVGTFFSYVFISHPLSDRLGRRYAAFTGTFIVGLGATIQASCGHANAFAMMITGRIICGVGVALVSTSVPLYQR
jgi:MFS family permease